MYPPTTPLPVFVLAIDGRYYKNPVFRGVTEEANRYLINFATEDRMVELVIEEPYPDNKPAPLLKALRFILCGYYANGIKWCRFAEDTWKMTQGKRYVLLLGGPIPVPREHQGFRDSRKDCPATNCIIFDRSPRPVYPKWRLPKKRLLREPL